MMQIDAFLYKTLLAQNSHALFFFAAISASVYALVLLFFIFVLYKKDKSRITKPVIGGLLLVFTVEILKLLAGRARPDFSGNDSFPSNHTALGFFFAQIFPAGKKYKALLYVWAGLIGMSRLAVGVHWFSDVLAGALIGLAFAFAIEKIKI